MKKEYPSEHAEQVVICNWLRERGHVFFAVPNGAKCGAKQANKLKREGLTPGVADLIIASKPTWATWPCLALEMKKRVGSGKGRQNKLSTSQKEWHEQYLQLGWVCLVAHGAEDAIQQLREYGYDFAYGAEDAIQQLREYEE
jgi:hypothetical protein